jgi:hypothetical protein
MSLHLTLEEKVSLEDATKFLNQVTTQQKADYQWLKPPANLGKVTASEILNGISPDQHIAKVKGWARCVWTAWSEYHPLIHKQLKVLRA